MSKTPTPRGGRAERTEQDAAPEGLATKVSHAYASALDSAGGAAREAGAKVEANPVAALLGGLAIGAAAGALIARSESEKALLAPLGERLNGAARAALEAGRAAGRDALGEAGLDVDTLREQAKKLLGQASAAAGTVGHAALDAAKDRVRGPKG